MRRSQVVFERPRQSDVDDDGDALAMIPYERRAFFVFSALMKVCYINPKVKCLVITPKTCQVINRY